MPGPSLHSVITGPGVRNATPPPLVRHAMISRERLAQLSRLDPGRVFRAVAFDYCVIAAAVVASEIWWSPALYAVAVMAIAGRLMGTLSIGLHDGAHRLIVRDRKRNDRLARLLLLPALIVSLAEYREQHFAHHRHINGAPDPDLIDYQNWYAASRWRRAWRLLAALIGLRVLIPVARVVLRGAWHERIVAIAVPGVLVAGVALHITPLRLIALYWIVPLMTWAMFINILRAVAEHYPPSTAGRHTDNPVFLTRDVRSSWFDAAFVVTRGVNYHLTHHLFPSVPYYRLATLHHEISSTRIYRDNAHVTRGYHRVLWEVVFDRLSDAVVSPRLVEPHVR
jgi:fatty acid desaturase